MTLSQEHKDDVDHSASSSCSSEEALLDMLGLPSAAHLTDDTADENPALGIPKLSRQDLETLLIQPHSLPQQYQEQSYCIFPPECSIPPSLLRQWTEALVWSDDSSSVVADKSYESIQVLKADGQIEHRRVLTRLERFVDTHDGWSELCHTYLPQLLFVLFGSNQPQVLYKEKLNLKPPGGSGFAPHLDTPSLRIALGKEGPQDFITVMVAIDDMTIENGCLRICPGNWSEDNHVKVIEPEQDGNPDAGGRAGAIPLEIAEPLEFVDIQVKAGTIVAFNGWAPHRSKANASPYQPRRAVFLTYNPQEQGDFHKLYYDTMAAKRQAWRQSVGLCQTQEDLDAKAELDALNTIPKI